MAYKTPYETYDAMASPPPGPLPLGPPLPYRSKPIAIPAASVQLGSPFLRAYPPILAQYGIAPADFLTFLDNLNRAGAANPATRGAGLVGDLLGFIPLQTAQLVGNAVKISADVATYGVNKVRTDRCLKEANEQLFGPRGLEAAVAKLDEVAQMAGMPREFFDPATGKIGKNASLLGGLPLEAELSELGAAAPTVQQRRLQALEPWLEPLEMVPLPLDQSGGGPTAASPGAYGASGGDASSFDSSSVQTGNSAGGGGADGGGGGFGQKLDKVAIKMSEREKRKAEEKLVKGRYKAVADYHKDTAKVEAKHDKNLRKLEKEASKGKAKDYDKLEREHRKIEDKYTKEIEKVQNDRQKHDKEEKVLRKVQWLVIRPVTAQRW